MLIYYIICLRYLDCLIFTITSLLIRLKLFFKIQISMIPIFVRWSISKKWQWRRVFLFLYYRMFPKVFQFACLRMLHRIDSIVILFLSLLSLLRRYKSLRLKQRGSFKLLTIPFVLVHWNTCHYTIWGILSNRRLRLSFMNYCILILIYFLSLKGVLLFISTVWRM